MKKALLIGASSESIHSIKIAKEDNIKVYAIDGNKDAEGFCYSDFSYVIDVKDKEAIINKAKEIDPDFILVPPIGKMLTTIGAVNDALNLKGVNLYSANACTDKWLFHSLLSEKGLRNCNCYLISKDRDFTTNINNMHYPIILKPRFGSGSRGITICMNPAEANDNIKILIENTKEDYILEELVPGDEYGIDGAVIEGKFFLTLLRKKHNSPLPYRQNFSNESINNSIIYEKLSIFFQKVVSILKINNSLFHADIILPEKIDSPMAKNDFTPFIIELSARPSGHYLHDYFVPLSTGIDPAKEMIKYLTNQDFSFYSDNINRMIIKYFSLKGKVLTVPCENDVRILLKNNMCELIDWKCNIKKGDILAFPKDGHTLMPRGYFVIKAKANNINIKDISNQILDLFGCQVL